MGKINEKTTEAMSVVSMSLDYVSPAHLTVKRLLLERRGFGVRPRQNFDAFEIRFSGISNRRSRISK